MKMNLKNKNFKKFSLNKIKFSSKNLFIFLVSFSIFAIILGIIFYFLLSSQDKNSINTSITNYFVINNNIDYLKELKNNILVNTYSIFIIWILGISVIGILASVFLYFCELFSIGFSLAAIINTYSAKGIIYSIIYLFPSKICYLIVLFILTFFSIKISYKIIRICFTKDEIDIKKEISKYFKVLLFSFIIIIGISMLKVFIDPFLIRSFTKI